MCYRSRHPSLQAGERHGGCDCSKNQFSESMTAVSDSLSWPTARSIVATLLIEVCLAYRYLPHSLPPVCGRYRMCSATRDECSARHHRAVVVDVIGHFALPAVCAVVLLSQFA